MVVTLGVSWYCRVPFGIFTSAEKALWTWPYVEDWLEPAEVARWPVGHVSAMVAARRRWQQARLEVAPVNGHPGLLVWTPDGALRVITFALRDGRIQDVFLMVNPDKLQRVRQH